VDWTSSSHCSSSSIRFSSPWVFTPLTGGIFFRFIFQFLSRQFFFFLLLDTDYDDKNTPEATSTVPVRLFQVPLYRLTSLTCFLTQESLPLPLLRVCSIRNKTESTLYVCVPYDFFLDIDFFWGGRGGACVWRRGGEKPKNQETPKKRLIRWQQSITPP